MEKLILAEYADMIEEIKDLRRRINKDKKELERLNGCTVVDSVSCGKKGKKPLRTVKIEGAPRNAIERKKRIVKKNIALLRNLEAELLEKQTEAEEYIQQIEKSDLRTMFRLYYIDNLPWYKVALEMNRIFPKSKRKYTEDSCRMRHNRFFEEK